MGQTQSNEKTNRIKKYQNILSQHLLNNTIKEIHGSSPLDKILNEIKKNTDGYSSFQSQYIKDKIIEEINNICRTIGFTGDVTHFENANDTKNKKELLINIIYLHETRYLFYELINSELAYILKKNGILNNNSTKKNESKFNIKENKSIWLNERLGATKNDDIKNLFNTIKDIVKNVLEKHNFLLEVTKYKSSYKFITLIQINNKNDLHHYLLLEMAGESSPEILKKPTMIETIIILNKIISNLLKINKSKDYIKTGNIKKAIDIYQDKNIKNEVNNILNAGKSIINQIEKELENFPALIRPSSPRNVVTVTRGGVNKSKINKQDSIKKMKLKQQKEMNKLKLKQKNELLKLKNKQKKELKSKSKKSTNKCCNCKKNFSSKASLTNHKKKCN